jgi:hypothetical protein
MYINLIRRILWLFNLYSIYPGSDLDLFQVSSTHGIRLFSHQSPSPSRHVEVTLGLYLGLMRRVQTFKVNLKYLPDRLNN